MNEYRPGGFLSLPPVVKYLIIINIAIYILTIALGRMGIDLYNYLAVYSIKSQFFNPYQLITHIFMHGGLSHLFFNMFALWMFGKTLEEVWDSKRFFIYYFVCGLGAALLHLTVQYFQIQSAIGQMDAEAVKVVMSNGAEVISNGMNYTDLQMRDLNTLINTPTVGASGAIYGLLLAFGVMFPNSVIYLYFAIPIKAKYFVALLAGLELYLEFSSHGDHIAHLAHLGGMLFGLIFLLVWKKHDFNRWN